MKLIYAVHIFFVSIMILMLLCGCNKQVDQPLENEIVPIEQDPPKDETISDVNNVEEQEITPEDELKKLKGKILNNVYINEYFEIKINIPDAWHIFDEQKLAQIEIQGEQQMNDPLNGQEVVKSIALFGFENRIPQMSTTSSIVGYVEAVDDAKNIKMAVTSLVDAYKSLGIPLEEMIEETDISYWNIDFTHKQIILEGGLTSIKQDIYVGEKEGYFIYIIVTRDEDIDDIFESLVNEF